MSLPTPHLDKLKAALENEKLPANEKPRLQQAIQKYNQWIADISNIDNDSESLIPDLIQLFNDYKFYIDYDLIFCSPNDFLYRQKGQLKLDNTVIEEFLPHLTSKKFPSLNNTIVFGPRKCFSAMYFKSTLNDTKKGGGVEIRTKDQDFAIAKKLFIRTSHNDTFTEYETKDAYLGYVTSECKTNLDKTMFQEANATAHDVKTAIPGSKYFLLCEWLDMTPVSTAPTDIDEVLILRKAKRISSNIRKNYSTSAGRVANADSFKNYLESNPYDANVFTRFLNHIESMLNDEDPEEGSVLTDGYF
ncbi:Bpu10I family restriction endonuclease [Muricauda sp. 2012CJ35-5]|uniref:Bpu10I family restriction endonuclease n=1 Tax=Flagellimonas spongiicola TaxID=2942208 RepID=A0ABT0PU86_9FLAO|nr:Bpu10I family restriction endonuclease [Allomuricauda spongiicola]MCL6274949.1 Bpu10I family restriction endonuclease [Allomuricauda spongiicola]